MLESDDFRKNIIKVDTILNSRGDTMSKVYLDCGHSTTYHSDNFTLPKFIICWPCYHTAESMEKLIEQLLPIVI